MADAQRRDQQLYQQPFQPNAGTNENAGGFQVPEPATAYRHRKKVRSDAPQALAAVPEQQQYSIGAGVPYDAGQLYQGPYQAGWWNSGTYHPQSLGTQAQVIDVPLAMDDVDQAAKKEEGIEESRSRGVGLDAIFISVIVSLVLAAIVMLLFFGGTFRSSRPKGDATDGFDLRTGTSGPPTPGTGDVVHPRRSTPKSHDTDAETQPSGEQVPPTGASSSRRPGTLLCVLGTMEQPARRHYPKDGLCDVLVFSSVYPTGPGDFQAAEGSSQKEFEEFLYYATTAERTRYALSMDGIKRKDEVLAMAQSNTMVNAVLKYSSNFNIKGYGMIVGSYNDSSIEAIRERLSVLFTELRDIEPVATLFLGITVYELVRTDLFRRLRAILDILILRTHEPASYDKRSQCVVKATASYSSNRFTALGQAVPVAAVLHDRRRLEVALSLTMMVVHYIVPGRYHTSFIDVTCADMYTDTYGEICRPGWKNEPVRDMYQSSVLHRGNTFDVRYYETAETIKQKVEAAQQFLVSPGHRPFAWAVFDVLYDDFTGKECDSSFRGLRYTRLSALKSQMVVPYDSRALRENEPPPENAVRKISNRRVASAQKV